MRVGLNTVKQYTNVDVSVDELVAKINGQLGGVEEVIDLGKRYKDAVIVRVVKCEKHPNADKLSICEIDAGTGKNVQVVCGAPNVREGLFVVWLPPSSIVPSTFDDKEPFVLEPKELRGVMSNGMLASAKELGISESHDGILEIDPTEWKPTGVEIKPGAGFATTYGLDDTIIDIENKMFTHRPDCFGQLGVAREIAGIQHKQFVSPDWYKNVPTFVAGEGLALEVFNDAGEKAPRFMAVAIKNVAVKPSPLWLQIELVRLGGKPINNIVDVTNYIMLLTGQPTHAYDYDKLRGAKYGSRMAKKGEKVKLLNRNTYELDETDIVIVDAEGPIGLGGVMGGADSEVSESTKNIVLECVTFDMYTVRKTSMRHGLFTDAVTRYNKGQSPLQNPHVLNLLMQSIHDVAGGEQASNVFDETAIDHQSKSTPVSVEFINSRLGLKLTADEVKKLLENVEFSVQDNNELKVTPPFWRTDIDLPEDIVEEVGRLYGFDKLPRELPKRSIKPAPKNTGYERAQFVRDALSRAGANEVLTYSFVHENVIKKAGQNPIHAFRLSNALSPDLQYYRLSLTPSLLDKVHMNIKAGFDQFGIFELNKVHYKGEMDPDEPEVPNEDNHIAFVIAGGKQKSVGSPYYQAQKYLEQIMNIRAVSLVPLVDFDLATDERSKQLAAPYEPMRSAVIVKEEQVWGVVGEYRASVKKAFKLPDFVAGFEVNRDILVEPKLPYTPLSKYPSTERDICFQVETSVSYQQIVEVVSNILGATELETVILPVDIYQPEGGTTKNVTLRITLASREKTLTSEEVSGLVSLIEQAATKTVHATII